MTVRSRWPPCCYWRCRYYQMAIFAHQLIVQISDVRKYFSPKAPPRTSKRGTALPVWTRCPQLAGIRRIKSRNRRRRLIFYTRATWASCLTSQVRSAGAILKRRAMCPSHQSCIGCNLPLLPLLMCQPPFQLLVPPCFVRPWPPRRPVRPRFRGYFPPRRFPLTHGNPARFPRPSHLFDRLAPTVGRMALPPIPQLTSHRRALPTVPRSPRPRCSHTSMKRRADSALSRCSGAPLVRCAFTFRLLRQMRSAPRYLIGDIRFCSVGQFDFVSGPMSGPLPKRQRRPAVISAPNILMAAALLQLSEMNTAKEGLLSAVAPCFALEPPTP